MHGDHVIYIEQVGYERGWFECSCGRSGNADYDIDIVAERHVPPNESIVFTNTPFRS